MICEACYSSFPFQLACANHPSIRITFLPDRDPMRRTHTAHVDFSSRKAAVEASFIAGQVYGLIFSVELALPMEYVPSE